MTIRTQEGKRPAKRPRPRTRPAAKDEPGYHPLTPRGLLPAATEALEVQRPPAGAELTDTEAAASEQAIDTFAETLGGRRALTEVLQFADTQGAADRVIEILLDPRYESWSLRKVCATAGITVADLFAAYRKAALARAHIQATALIAGKLLPVVEDVMSRAVPVPIRCPMCGGTPTPRGELPCEACAGTGLVRSEPDLDRQKLALELGQLTARTPGFVVQQNQAIALPTPSAQAHAGGTLEQLHQAVGGLLFAPTRRRAASPGSHRPGAMDDPRDRPEPRHDPPVIDIPVGDPPDDDPDDDDEEEDPDDLRA